MLKKQPMHSYSQLRSLEHQLADTRHAFEDFAYTVAHDLNAPLRCIVSFSQLLEEKYRSVLDEKALHYVDLITENSRKAQARLASLLQYSRLDTVPMKPEHTESRVLIDHCLEQLSQEIEERDACIHIDPLPMLIADGERLALLWYCLLSNALKFCTTRPEITITAQRGHEAWVFAVHDNGIGIAAKDHDIIFNVFRRLHKESDYGGTGMGLALARRIVELHGGIIWVESSLGQGTALYFTIPDILPLPPHRQVS